ncbi:hypothetical protein L6164_014510 [Bauhinia variegata]|uniref:Uncharacterized protein n=1 Tax=Bauhinia variegata TaxID=167791 RepID=A0ACB9NJJ0_BAUVA|nr:hypothetical protein L6164_014510 [Bauhinia variegata]
MAALAFTVLLLALTGSTNAANWCVCKDGGDAVLQKTLDYACGAGADCNPIHQNGPCFQPNTVRAHCNYAVNSYFQKKGQVQDSCAFAGTATIVTSDPSTTGCVYPSSASAAGTSTTPVSTTGTPSTTTGSTTPTSTTAGTTPYSSTPGVLGGIGNGMGPSGSGINTDDSHGGLRLVDSGMLSALSTLLLSGLMML